MVDEARVLEFNKRVKGYKEQYQRLSMQKDVKEENLKRSLEEASKALGVEVTEENVEQILKEYTEKVNSQMENGEAIFKRINGKNEQSVQNESVQQAPVQQVAPVQQAPVQQAPMNQFQQNQMDQNVQQAPVQQAFIPNQQAQQTLQTPQDQQATVQNNEQQDSVFSQWNMGNAMNPFNSGAANNGAANNNPFGGNQMFSSLNNGIPSGQNII